MPVRPSALPPDHTCQRFAVGRALLCLALAITQPCRAARAEPPAEAPLADEDAYLTSEEGFVYAPLKRRQPIARSPSSVRVFTADEIRASGARNLGEFLRRLPELSREVLSSGETAIDGARGVGGEMTIFRFLEVRLDGRSVRQEWLGVVFYEPLPIFLDDVKRIEIIRGPAGALYGESGLNLVIDIRTRTPEEAQGTQLQVAAYGPTQGFEASGVHGLALGPVWSKLSVSYRSLDEFDSVVPPQDDGDDTASKGLRVASRSALDLGHDGRIEAELGYTDGSVDVLLGAPLSLHGASERSALVSYDRELPFGSLAAEWTWTEFATEVVPPRGAEAARVHADSWSGEIRHTAPLPLAQTLVSGVSYRYVSARGDLFDESRALDDLGLFLADEIDLGANLTAYANLRGELLQPSGSEILPGGSLVWTPAEGHTLRASVGRGVAAPSLFGLHGAFNLSPGLKNIGPPFDTLDFVVLGNPDLESQALTSYELGYRGVGLDGRVTAVVNGYFQDVRKLAAAGYFGPDTIAFEDGRLQIGIPIANRYSYHVVGGEASLELRPLAWLRMELGYALAHVLDEHDLVSGAPSHALGDVTRQHRGLALVGVDFRKGTIPAPWLRPFDAEISFQATSTSEVETLPSQIGAGRYPILAGFLGEPTTRPGDRYLNARLGWTLIPSTLEVALEGWNLLGTSIPLWVDGTRLISLRMTVGF